MSGGNPIRRAFVFARQRSLFLISLVIVCTFWEISVRMLQVPEYILPGPLQIVGRVVSDFTSGLIFLHFRVTFTEVLTGFGFAALIGVTLGTAIGLISTVEKIVYPYILIIQTVPKVAIAPLLIIWIGFGMQSKVITAAVLALFPILVNVISGLKTVDPRRMILMRALRANRTQTFLKVRLPSMLPYLFAGLEIGIIFAVIGAIVGEFLGASVGLGSLVIQRQSAIDVPGVLSILIYLSTMGIVCNVTLKTLSRRYAFWARNAEANSI